MSYTKGPWFSDKDGSVWRRAPKELYQNGGGAAGDRPVATAHRGWHHEGSVGFPVEANARLMAAAPELLAVAECEEALDMPPEQGCAVLERYGWSRANRFELSATEFVRRMRRAAIAKATGQQL